MLNIDFLSFIWTTMRCWFFWTTPPPPPPPSPSYKEFKICDVTMTPRKTAALFTLKLQRLESCLVKLGLKLFFLKAAHCTFCDEKFDAITWSVKFDF